MGIRQTKIEAAEDLPFDPQTLVAYRGRTSSPDRTLVLETAGGLPLPEAHGDMDEEPISPEDILDLLTAFGPVRSPKEDLRADVKNLYGQLSALIQSNPKLFRWPVGEENTDSAAQPLHWISKWACSNKFGLGYQLSGEGSGVIFGDTTTLILLPNDVDVHFIDREGRKTHMTRTDYPKTLKEKMKHLEFYKRYMSDKMLTTVGAKHVKRIAKDEGAKRMPHLNFWFRTACATVMLLSNGSVQLNFVAAFGHKKLLLCPHKSAVTCMDRNGYLRTYRFESIIARGSSGDLFQQLLIAHEHIAHMLYKM